MKAEKILVVDDDAAIVFALRRTFEKEGYAVVSAPDGVAGLEALRSGSPDLVFLDLTMPELDGISVLTKVREEQIDVPVVIMTGFGTMQKAIQAVQLGAYDYITKPLDVDQIRSVARRALEFRRLQEEVRGLRTRLLEPSSEDSLIGNDLKIQEVYKAIGAVTTTPNETAVLITGESGTGKELVARAIHAHSPAGNEPFVGINCAALPANLLESELFGHERGAFTGAIDRKPGRFEMARGGTIFLDEIGGLVPELQQKLLRVLQEREFARLGGNASIPVRARFVAATNKDLEGEIRRGAFREDLYFRLNVMAIHLPPLRERRADIPSLVDHFLSKYSRILNKRISGISPQVMDTLGRYDWPGNVRELENVIERCVILARGEVILPDTLPEQVRQDRGAQAIDVPITGPRLEEARRDLLAAFEQKFVAQTLKATGGNVTEAARRAGIERQSFQRLMGKYGINSETFRGDAGRG
ncbi:MAG: sigma-54-dependent Fis family transcriptional regulator [Candidatus Latescibacteria bacterium]|nr:sigma-54-dependent Fis family transcriptional regulator [Candidatus Latescibacterota bacterium]